MTDTPADGPIRVFLLDDHEVVRRGLKDLLEVGGYMPRRTPYNITIRNMTITSTCTGRATSASRPAMYASASRDGTNPKVRRRCSG